MVPLPNVQPIEHFIPTPPEGPLTNAETPLDIVKVWYTIQGEGPFAGSPAVFVRLAGCNLTCPMCDTNYTEDRKTVRSIELRGMVAELQWKAQDGSFRKTHNGHHPLVVLTGGEPLRQPIGYFCQLLLWAGYRVQVETNGIAYREELPFHSDRFHIVCSPKTHKIAEELKPHIECLKYVVDEDSHNPQTGLPLQTLGRMDSHQVAEPWEGFKGDIYLQPAESPDPAKCERNRKIAVHYCMKYGYRLCLQQHKLLGLE